MTLRLRQMAVQSAATGRTVLTPISPPSAPEIAIVVGDSERRRRPVATVPYEGTHAEMDHVRRPLLLVGGATQPFAAETVAPNDNRRTVGTLENGVLTVALEARTGRWKPEGDGGRTLGRGSVRGRRQSRCRHPGRSSACRSERPCARRFDNRLDKPLTVFGFGKTRGLSDSVVVPVECDDCRCRSRRPTPGTYYYVGAARAESVRRSDRRATRSSSA